MSYVVKEVQGTKGILETKTETFIVYNKKTDKEIQSIARKLNLGSGFNGWTPQFFAGNVKYK
jgi:hypothetical protein